MRGGGGVVRRMTRRVASGVMLATAAAAIALGAVSTTAAEGAARPLTTHGVISGRLGYEGGAYPGRFHPTAGLVKVAGPQKVGPIKVPVSGHFSVPVVPGDYTLTGCGGTKNKQCGPPQQVTVKARGTSHVQVPWLLAP
jgi:hypothetical protein